MVGNKIFCYLLYSCLLQAAFYYDSVNSKLYVIKGATHLKSSDFKYPTNNETLDVVWLFDHSIRLKVNDFHLDGHSGDFVLISDLPLLYADDFVNGTSDESYVSDLARSILTNQGLLLSWKVNKTIEAVNPRGTFVLFHTEANVPGSTASFEGFDIEVVNLDDARTTTTSTTPDPIIPERPDQQLYISKFLSCMHPIEFFNKTNIFKARIAQIATEYCSENNIPLQQGDISAQEVNIPGPNEGTYAGLHYCDSSWPVYNSCVEVTFSIVRVEDGDYVLPAGRLEEMWKQKSQDLIQYGYCPYIPLNELQDLNTVIFIAFFMGIIISLVALSIVVWIRTQSFLVFRNRRVAAGKVVEEEPPTQIKFYDPQNNPIYNFIPNTVKSYTPGSEMYPGGDYLGIGDDDLPPQLTRRSFTENPAFKDTHTEVEVYAFDNSGFEQDEGSARVPRSENEDADEFLIMPRVIPGSISDTEA